MPDRLSWMIMSLHFVLFYMFFVMGSSAMLRTNPHTYHSPCARHRHHVDTSCVRLVQRVRITLGRSSQLQNIATSRWLMFSDSQQSRRNFRILQLSMIFAKFDTSISNSVFSVRYRFARYSSSCLSLTLTASAPISTPRGVLSHILSDTTCKGIAGTWNAGARGIHWSVGELELDSLSGPFAGPVP